MILLLDQFDHSYSIRGHTMKNMKMPTKDPSNFDWLSALIFVALAVFGAVAKSAFDVISGKSFEVKVFFCQLIVSMFAGMLSILIASSLNLSFEMTGCLVGSAGWLGGDMVKAIAEKMKNKID